MPICHTRIRCVDHDSKCGHHVCASCLKIKCNTVDVFGDVADGIECVRSKANILTRNNCSLKQSSGNSFFAPFDNLSAPHHGVTESTCGGVWKLSSFSLLNSFSSSFVS